MTQASMHTWIFAEALTYYSYVQTCAARKAALMFSTMAPEMGGH